MFKRTEAADSAYAFMKAIRPYCEEVFLAGSILRGCEMVNDIDIVAIPRFETQADESLFGTPVEINILERALTDMIIGGDLELDDVKKSDGEKKKRFKSFQDVAIPIDIYFATPKTFITLCLIRTGSKNHNIKLCMQAIRLGMELKADGSGLIGRDGKLIQPASIDEIFQHLQLPYVKPEERI